MEIKLELGAGVTTKPVIAMCLSNLFLDVKNWSTNVWSRLNIFSFIIKYF